MRGGLIGVVLALLAVAPADAQTEFKPAYPDQPLLGPQQAKGAIIWNHGLGRLTQAGDQAAWFVDYFRDAGWDAFTLARLWASDRVHDSSEALIGEGKKLRAQGYGRVVSAGQSFGGWISYAAVGRSEGVFDAIVTVAAAAHGEVGVSNNWQLNADNLYGLARSVSGTRVISFFFEKDSFDPGGRGNRVRSILTDRGIPNYIVDPTPEFFGHGAGTTIAFARQFGPCILAFVEPPSAPNEFSCQPYRPRPDPRWFPRSANSRVSPAAEAPAPLASLLGQWYGWYASGLREALLTVEQIDSERAVVVYAPGPQRRGDKTSAQRRTCKVDAAKKALHCAESERSTLDYALRPDGRLDMGWARPDGQGWIGGILTKIE